MFRPEQGTMRRGADASDVARCAHRYGRPKRGTARAARARTDDRRCDGDDDEGGEADDEDAPSRAAAPGRVEVEPPSATGETTRCRGGDGEDGPDGEDAPPLAAIPRACRYRALDRYRRDGATPR